MTTDTALASDSTFAASSKDLLTAEDNDGTDHCREGAGNGGEVEEVAAVEDAADDLARSRSKSSSVRVRATFEAHELASSSGTSRMYPKTAAETQRPRS